MLLTLLALAGALIALEEIFSRLARPAWRVIRWYMLPLGALIVVHYVPVGVFGYPVIMDTWTGVLLALMAAALVGLHGTFRDAHWSGEDTKKANRHVPPHIEHRARAQRATTPQSSRKPVLTARAPLKSRP